jgi:hypothetical protein
VKTLRLCFVILALLAPPSLPVFGQVATAGPGAIGPSYFGPTYQGFGGYGNGIYGPGYYGPGTSGLRLGGSGPLGVDPSLHYHTYPSYSSPAPRYGAPLAPVFGSPLYRNPRALSPAPVTRPSRGAITIVHDKEAASDIRYTLNGATYTIKPGYVQKFEDDRTWVIAFDAGDAKRESKKELRYTLATGTYSFQGPEGAIDLRQVVAKAAAPAEAAP